MSTTASTTSRYGYGQRFTANPVTGVRQPLDMSVRADDQHVTVVAGDRLDNLAAKYLGNPEYWWVIADWNAIRFPLVLTVGTTLRMPSRTVLSTLL
jgi:nucleoid-associated protein YgaU